MKLHIICLLFSILLLGGWVFADSSNGNIYYANTITIDNRDYIVKSADSKLAFFPVDQAIRVMKSVIGINDTKDTQTQKDITRSGSIVGGTKMQALPKSEYVVIQRAIRNHKKALDAIANVIKKNNNKKSLLTIEKLHKQTSETLHRLENELKKPAVSKTEIKNTVSLIQKQIKQIQSELKMLDK